MVDATRLKENIDCRELFEQDLGPAKVTGSNYKQWQCPLHKESHGHSLTAWKQCWKCFGACQVGGDAFRWMELYHGMTFAEAARALGAPDGLYRQPTQPRIYPEPEAHNTRTDPPSLEWQIAVRNIVERAAATLWTDKGAAALEYLRNNRGLLDATIRNAQLGYVPGNSGGAMFLNGQAVPCGITIPTFADDQLWGVKVRRMDPRPQDVDKYGQIGTTKKNRARLGSGNLAGSLYMADELLPGWPALICEGEFDALVAWQEARDLVCPVTVGSASNNLNPYWYAPLAGCNPILLCTDTDEAGEKAATRLLQLGARVHRITPPQGKDISEFYQQSPMKAVWYWLETVLSSSTQKASAA